MVTKTIEEISDMLEKLQKEVERIKAVHEIQNLMGKYVNMHEVARDHELPDMLYAQKTPGVSAEVGDLGVFLGQDGIRRLLVPRKGDTKGTLMSHPLTTPVIEVAGDGKTAKGVWWAQAFVAGGRNPKTGKPGAFFEYTKYGCDFVKEDNKWKVWHYHVYRLYETPFDKPWTDVDESNLHPAANIPSRPKADLPSTYWHPYSPTTQMELVPLPPEPYETFGETFSYGPPIQ
jgi:hypothetical protein